jgi:hypothetical protein
MLYDKIYKLLIKHGSCCLVAVYTIWTVLCWFFLCAGRMWPELEVDNGLCGVFLFSSDCNSINNFVALAKHKDKTAWRWCRCIETCRSAYDIRNIINIYICCAIVGLDNKMYKIHGTYIKIRTGVFDIW